MLLGLCAQSSSWLSPLSLQELVEDVAVATSSRHADLSWMDRFAVASPRFIGRRSASKVLSQDCLGWPALCLQSPGGSIMQAWRARWWSCQGSAWWRCPKNDRRRLQTVSDRSGCPVRERISLLVTNSDRCIFRMLLRHQLSSASIVAGRPRQLSSASTDVFWYLLYCVVIIPTYALLTFSWTCSSKLNLESVITPR